MQVGVLGGMGPDATVDFMARVLALTPASADQEHLHLLVDQNPHIPNRQRALAGEGEDPGPVLAAMAARLEACGCNFLVMPCNTAHAFAAEISAAVEIALISIIDSTLDAAADAGCVGLLATTACVNAGVYQQEFLARKQEFVLPSEAHCTRLTEAAFAVKAGDRSAAVANSVREVGQQLVNRGADLIVLACTELPLVCGPDDLGVVVLSSTDELARRTIAVAKGDMPLP